MKKAKIQMVLAIIGMVVLMIAGILLGTIRDMASFKAEAEEIFESGQDLNGDTIDSRIERVYKYGSEISKIAKETIELVDGGTISILQANDAHCALMDNLEELKNAKTPAVKYKLLKSVYENATVVCKAIEAEDFDESYKKDAAYSLAVIERSMERLEDFRADYNASAKAYNDKVNRFPYVFLAKPFLKELSLFD